MPMTTPPPRSAAESPLDDKASFSWLGIAAAYVFAISTWLALATVIVRHSLP